MRTMAEGGEGGRRDVFLHESVHVDSSTQKDAARALEMVHVQLISAVIDPYAWKWVILALHHALHVFLVASLESADDEESEEARPDGALLRVQPWRSAVVSEADELNLIGLYDAAKSATRLRSTEDLDQDVARLAQYRDALFRHVPARWTLRSGEMPAMTRNCLRIVEHLGWNPGHIHWRRENHTDLARVKYLASMKVLEALSIQHRA